VRLCGGRLHPRAALARIATKIDARHVVVASTKGSDDHTRVSVPISYHANLPGSEVLKRSSLAITQGGAGSSYQALGAKVPLGIWPAHRNHQLLGERLTQLGLAFPLHSRPLETAIDDFLRDRSEIMERLSRFTGMDSAVASLAAAAVIGELF